MIEFKNLDDNTSCELCNFYKNSTYLLSDYSIGLKKMWSDVLNPSFALSHGCVIVKNIIYGSISFDFPMPISEEHSISSALIELSEYCRENYIPFVLSNVPENHISDVITLYPRYSVTYNRKYSDYVYLAAKLSEMGGRTYSSQRNHIKKFHTRYPDAVFKSFGSDDIPSVKRFLKRFSDVFSKKTKTATTELQYAEIMIDRIGSNCFRCGGFVLDGEIISLCLCEKCGDMLIDHIEKALYEFEGIYPATVKAFLTHFGSDVKYFNREDDSGDKGLRTSKLQYKPYKVVHKYRISIQNELSNIKEIPNLESERLTYSAIRESDIDQYNLISLDSNINRFWGYDYKNECESPDREYFYNDQLSDFYNRLTMSLAIRLEDIMIGEVILHNFDCRGSCEIGIRLIDGHQGQGYGREALNAVINYALYEIGLDCVKAKCFKENRPSSNMLSTVMRLDMIDDTYEHYIATF